MEAGNPLLDDHLLELTGRDRPRICFLATASGDADHYVVRFYKTFAARCEASHVSLFRRDRAGVEGDVEGHLLTRDLVYVGGGSLLSMLGAWRAHGIDAILTRAWLRGTILCGLSAGSLCWFAEAVTAFHGPPQVVRGLGLLPYANCVHYDGEASRRTAFNEHVARGMRAGFGVEDGAALRFAGRELAEVVSSRPAAGAYRVEPDGRGSSAETPLAARYLGEPALAGAA